MSKRKKNQKAMQKRRQKSLEKKRQKQKQKKKQQMPTMVEYDRSLMLGISEMDVTLPDGFRAVSNSQAITEYAKPLMDEAGDDYEKLNRALQFGMLFWNHALAIRRGTPQEEAEADVQRLLIELGFPGSEETLRSFIREQVDRFNAMFPEDMQKRSDPRHMIMRNLKPVEIKAYDYTEAKLSDEIVPPGSDDEEFLEKLEELDEHIEIGSDYDEYEELYQDVTKLAMKRFDLWLVDKKAPEKMRSMWGCLEIFMSYVYAYGNAETLGDISRVELEEFFYDHLLRKMSAEPDEYTEWPAAIKFFYQFLGEKDYMDDAVAVIKMIDEIEPFFIKVLKKRFG